MAIEVHRFGTVGSTNDVAFDLLAKGHQPPFWVIGERQTAGRGRMDRGWTSDSGNLFASLLLHEPAPPGRLATLSLVAGVAVRRAIAGATGVTDDVTLKWPNDVLLNDAKVAGILIEARTQHAVVIGCGINCTSHPTGTSYGATDLAAEGLVTPPETLFAALEQQLPEVIALWARGANFSAVREEWLASAKGIGATATVMRSDGAVSGIVRTIDMDGRLILEVAGNDVAIASGDLVSG